jgi:2'-5' RNA ligase
MAIHDPLCNLDRDPPNMPDTTRTFVALAVPDKLGEKLKRLQSLLAPEIPGTRWSETMPFHATLAFLGDVANTDLNDVCRTIAAATVGAEPLALRIEGPGVFPNPKRARVVWVGVTGAGIEGLGVLQKRIADAVAGAGYPVDDSRFHPHVTLGRMKPGRVDRDLTPLLNHYRTWAAGGFTLDEIVAFASTLTPDGPIYTPLTRIPLGVRKQEPKT